MTLDLVGSRAESSPNSLAPRARMPARKPQSQLGAKHVQTYCPNKCRGCPMRGEKSYIYLHAPKCKYKQASAAFFAANSTSPGTPALRTGGANALSTPAPTTSATPSAVAGAPSHITRPTSELRRQATGARM